MTDLVQAILVPKGDHPHKDVVMAVAIASVKALLYSNTPDKQAVRYNKDHALALAGAADEMYGHSRSRWAS